MTERPTFGFHSREGWHFQRDPDGAVTITLTDTDGVTVKERVTLDRDTWASVLASVSFSGANGPTFRAAQQFHSGSADA